MGFVSCNVNSLLVAKIHFTFRLDYHQTSRSLLVCVITTVHPPAAASCPDSRQTPWCGASCSAATYFISRPVPNANPPNPPTTPQTHPPRLSSDCRFASLFDHVAVSSVRSASCGPEFGSGIAAGLQLCSSATIAAYCAITVILE
jgi:hypothetical protein